MIQSISEVGASTEDKQNEEDKEELKKKKKWGPFYYFVFVSSVLILVMWGIIIFGGQKAPPRTVDFAKKGRILLFMVDGAIRRYARYEGNIYPEHLPDLVPKHLSLKESEALHLKRLSYQRDPKIGYSLSLTTPKPGEMNIILTPKGIEFTPPWKRGA